MIKKRYFLLPILCVALALSFFVQAKDVWAGRGITVEKAYAYATSSVQKNGAAFVVLKNHSDEAVKVIAAETDVAKRIELHTHTHDHDSDMMQMRQVESFEIPAQGTITLEPMGDHIMLFGLKDKLVQGESFEMTVSFDTQDPVIADVQIIKPGMKH